MTFTYTVSTDAGKVRMLIPDRVEASAFFSDDEIDAFLAMEDGVKRAAALALETMASDQAMVLKVIRTLDLSTDGRATSEALLTRAGKLREQADLDDANDDGGFEIAEWAVSEFAYRDIVNNAALRSAV